MAKTEPPAFLRPKLEKFVKNAKRRAKQLKKVPGTANAPFFSSRLKRIDSKIQMQKKLLAKIAKYDKEIEKLYADMSKAYYSTKEKCDGYLSEGEMGDLF